MYIIKKMDFKNIEFKFNINEKELKELTEKFISDYKELLDITLTEKEDKKIYKIVDDVIYNELILETLKKLRDNDENLKENYIFNKVNKRYLKDESVFIEQFIYDVRFNSEIHIYKDMVINEREHKVFNFNYLFDYSKEKYNKYKDELDLLIYEYFIRLLHKYKKKDNDFIEIPLKQTDIYGDVYETKLRINFIKNEKEFINVKKIWVDSYNFKQKNL